MASEQIGIFGAGAFGTALGMTLAAAGHPVVLWARDPQHVAAMQSTRRNDRQVAGVDFPASLNATADIADLSACPVVLLAVPTQSLRAALRAHAPYFAGKVLVATCKGVELSTGVLPSDVVGQEVPDAQIGVLTGPSFAADIARGKPTALTLAATAEVADHLQAQLSTPTLRLYASDDLIGAQLGGALKNVVAIAAGVAIGAGLGESARAALMTRGYAEMVRYAIGRGAQADTLAGLSGFGDLVLTCTSDKSRNFNHGLALGAGLPTDQSKTVEGVMTAHAVAAEATRLGLDLPVTQMVSLLLHGKVTQEQAIQSLLSRPLRREV